MPKDHRLPPAFNASIPESVTLITRRLKENGFQAYIVGGALRDACLHRPFTDWDIATSANASDIIEIFKDGPLFSLREKTVTLVRAGRHVEVTPFKGRGASIDEDLAHRDFTVNAMAYDPETGEHLDPFGAVRDMGHKCIRAVKDPGSRFKEDPLRLLRAIRLSSVLGFHINSKTKRAIILMARLLRSCAGERIREEFMGALLSKRPSSALRMMRQTGLLEVFLPELLEGYRLRQNHHHRFTVYRHILETVDLAEPTPIMRLTALLHDIAKPRVRKKRHGNWSFHGHEEASAQLARVIMDRLRFSHGMIGKVTHLIRHHMILYQSEWSDAAVRRLIRRVKPENMMDMIKFRRADLLAHGGKYTPLEQFEELVRRIELQMKGEWAVKTSDLAINGHRIMEVLGIRPGPKVGKILHELLDKVTDQPALNTESTLISLLKNEER